MALPKRNPQPATENKQPTFETVDEEGNEVEAEVTASPAERLAAAAAERATASAAAKAPAVIPPKAGQVAVAKAMVNPLEPLKNAFFCEFDTLRSLKISSGNLVDNQTSKPLGDTVGLELLSYQDQWVVSPGVEGDEGKEHVRYSDDGKTTSKGEDCAAYLEQLKSSGYPEAKTSKRTVICGSLFDIGEKGRKTLPEIQDCLVQISLAPTSKAGFDRYMMDQAFRIGKGLIQPEGADRIKIECVPASKGDKDWTIATFARWE
jgi:hypothetical protein